MVERQKGRAGLFRCSGSSDLQTPPTTMAVRRIRRAFGPTAYWRPVSGTNTVFHRRNRRACDRGLAGDTGRSRPADSRAAEVESLRPYLEGGRAPPSLTLPKQRRQRMTPRRAASSLYLARPCYPCGNYIWRLVGCQCRVAADGNPHAAFWSAVARSQRVPIARSAIGCPAAGLRPRRGGELHGGVAAIDQHVGAGHEAGGVAGEKQRRPRDLIGLAEPHQQMLRPGDAPRLLHVAVAQHQASRFDRAGRKGVDPDVLPGVIDGHCPRQLDDRALRCAQ